MLSSNALFGASCAIAFCLAFVVPAFAAWGTPVACAILCGILIAAMPLALRGHQWSILLSGTFYVAAASAVGYLVFGPVSASGSWEPGKFDLFVLGVGFAVWVAGIATATICYPLTNIPLTLQLTLPVAAFFLFQVSNFTRPRAQNNPAPPELLEFTLPSRTPALASLPLNAPRPGPLHSLPIQTPSKASTFRHLGTE